MNKRVYFLMTVSFVVGMVELLIGGILDLIAEDLNVSLGLAGMLITVFSLTFGIAAPVLLVLTAKMERKRLTLISLSVFLVGNIIAAISPVYSVLFVGRIISAISGSILIILCIVLAANIVEPKYRGRAIGVVSMGVSASLVLGVPIGLSLGNLFGWRAPFILIVILTVISMLGVHFFMERVPPRPVSSIKSQVQSLKNNKILFAHLTIFMMMSGHAVLYAYLTPFSQTTMGLEEHMISIVYLIFGIAAVCGGAFGGTMSDKFGSTRIIPIFIIIYAAMIFATSYSTAYLPLFMIVLALWGLMSWSVTPAMQTYLMAIDPETADMQISISNSALHFGIAFGSFIGGVTIDRSGVEINPFIGGLFVVIALATMSISLMQKEKQKEINSY
ncbi:MFS transporter [Oceanobacillus luteolus]|uniref:MFS transporter n=1 Tax=Oceanobacillus luteolus TaxID=1274358 RepID=A0ABW4HP58_9BACI|nr:MFS transporter [Oceanobacillus luteolus]MCM3740376.1 MFS transporter [Oceanobacillus luteolus]